MSLSGSFPLDWDSLGNSQVFGAKGHGQVQGQIKVQDCLTSAEHAALGQSSTFTSQTS